MKKYKSARGYYKYYNSEGKSLRIKFSKEFKELECKEREPNEKFKISLKFKHDEHWHYHTPSKSFANIFDVIKYLCTNTTTEGTIFKVLSFNYDNISKEIIK